VPANENYDPLQIEMRQARKAQRIVGEDKVISDLDRKVGNLLNKYGNAGVDKVFIKEKQACHENTQAQQDYDSLSGNQYPYGTVFPRRSTSPNAPAVRAPGHVSNWDYSGPGKPRRFPVKGQEELIGRDMYTHADAAVAQHNMMVDGRHNHKFKKKLNLQYNYL